MKNQSKVILEIKIREGLTSVPFKCDPLAVKGFFGEPDETDEIDSMCDGSLDTIIWNYSDPELSFCFDAASGEPKLITIETSNPEATLFGISIFDLDPAEVISLMNSRGFTEIDREDETWGEHRITFEDTHIDFYFENNELNLVSWSSS